MSDAPQPTLKLTTSPTLGVLAAALAQAQGKIKSAPKDHTAEVESKRTGQRYSYSYADLAGVWDAAREHLSANGLAVVQVPALDGHGHLSMTTLLVHASGEFIQSTLENFPVPDQTPQGVGTAITYARRYTFGAAVGVVSEEDDDGGNGGKPKPKSDGAKADASGAVFPYGELKGQPIAGADKSDLEWLAGAMRKAIADPAKDKFKAQNSALLVEVERELDKQKAAQVPPDLAPYHQALALAKANGWTEENAKHWLKTKRGKTGSSTVTAEDVAELRKALEPPQDDAPF